MFQQQINRAKARYHNKKFLNDGPAIINSRDDSMVYRSSVRDGTLQRASDRAYKSKDGFSIFDNPQTGEKEMFVRGTTFKRGGVEWAQNILESPIGGYRSATATGLSALSRYSRRQHSKFLSEQARKNGVSVVYGHSRGGAIVNDMDVPGARLIGLDAATILNKRSNISNIRQRQFFDRSIGFNAKKTYIVGGRVRPWNKRYHYVYK